MIGAGGVAEVYRVAHVDDPRSVAALKVMRRERQADKRHLQDFQHEFELLGQLRHPGIPAARRIGEIDGRACMLMDLVPGTTLAAEVSARTTRAAPALYARLVGIVSYLHQEGIVHNDLKLENVIHDAGSDHLALVDFGNARAPIRTSLFRRFLPKPKTVFGSTTYIAPELTAGHQPTFASDVYALGICAFQLFADALPFPARATQRVRKGAATVRAIQDHLPGLAQPAARAIDACLDPSPMGRPQSAVELHGAIACLATMEEQGRTTRTKRTKRTSRRVALEPRAGHLGR
ncbi:MAG: serine/threonine protein kinase [Planctomycetes bacterium]|nr:serine/threonine protein kinase [Planctomycetota bacterium]